MYNSVVIDKLKNYLTEHSEINDKRKLANLVQKEFNLIQDGKVFYCNDFAIRFCQSKTLNPSNTVLALSKLQKYDHIPFLVCIVTQTENSLLLANTSFLKKISHSSQELRVNNIKGSFNASDIMRDINQITNTTENFHKLFTIHQGVTFEDNLERLVEATNDIAANGERFNITENIKKNILNSPRRTIEFIHSKDYIKLKNDLDERVDKVRNEIAIAAFIENVNIRGRIIEYLITENSCTLKDSIISALQKNQTLPSFTTKDNLGDYVRRFPSYLTATDIKTKILFLSSAPKAYNIDKLLEFLSKPNTVYLFYIVGINQNKKITCGLFSAFDSRLLAKTTIQNHWAGRNKRGVTQVYGSVLIELLNPPQKHCINENLIKEFLENLIAL